VCATLAYYKQANSFLAVGRCHTVH
jgi:hypothetical protein